MVKWNIFDSIYRVFPVEVLAIHGDGEMSLWATF